ncbi:GNAT family N-acetyltransferase [Paraburkholderia sp. J94]|uniref:GNAT family N-acetyltransferase n=1 Tax=Paraburkholderia sp. J94 TaxID=2805441 RepID=UPI002AAF209B|nr:GNAT family N-acetyltransferase [Paraburkholderia sp. J94]
MLTIRIMTIDDYENVIDLMKRTPGVTFRDADSHEATRRYLERNPELSFIAKVGDETVGCIMSGHDGRRGYLQHLVVASAHRRQGIANALVECCIARLEALGIAKSHVDVIKTNVDAQAYWEHQGWQLRTDIDRYSFIRNGRSNA